MNHGRASPKRRQRKLPSIPPSRRPPDFWPSFRGAVDWLQKQQSNINTAISLLEIYPNLIRHKTCDRLWDFLSKVAFFDQLEVNKRKRELDEHYYDVKEQSKRAQETANLAFVTRKLDSIMAKSENSNLSVKRIQNLYICGNVDDDKWQHLVLDLCKRYHVRCQLIHEDGKDDTAVKMVFENDALLFLLDERSIVSPVFLQQLKAAQTWEIQVLFVRDKEFELPDSLSSIIEQNDNLRTPQPRIPSKETPAGFNRAPPCVSIQIPDIEITDAHNDPYIDDMTTTDVHHHNNLTPDMYHSTSLLTVDFPPESPTPFEHHRMFLTTPISRPDSGMSSCSSISNSSRGYATPTPQRTHKVYTKKAQKEKDGFTSQRLRTRSVSGLSHTRTPSPFSRRGVASAHKRPQSLIAFIKKCFRDSVTYNSDNHVSSLQSTVCSLEGHGVESRSGREISEWISCLKKPEDKQQADNKVKGDQDETQEQDPSLNVIEPELDRTMQSSDTFSPTPKHTGTLYAVYTKDAPKPNLIHWPADNDVPVADSPSVESFGFQDVDLSKKINDVQWSSEED